MINQDEINTCKYLLPCGMCDKTGETCTKLSFEENSPVKLKTNALLMESSSILEELRNSTTAEYINNL